MGIGVEAADHVHRAEVEAEEHLGEAIAIRLRQLTDGREWCAVDPLRDEHECRAQLGDRRRDVDEGVPAVRVREDRLVLSLQPVVELLEHAVT